MSNGGQRLPLPPVELARRVGSAPPGVDQLQEFDEIGAASRRDLLAAVPTGFSWDGARVLDFGAGAGRTLRHFGEEARHAHFAAVEIHGESVAWLRKHLQPPVAEIHQTSETPPLPFADGSFDLVYAVSVFSHLTDHWAAWIAELHRILAPDGLLLATFMGPGMSWALGGAWPEGRIGMTVVGADQPWDEGGPMVVHEPWWLEAHWGRAFTVERLQPAGFISGDDSGQGLFVGRRRPGQITAKLVAAPEPDPRETAAVQRQLEVTRDELRATQSTLAETTARVRELDDLARSLEAAVAERDLSLRQLRESRALRAAAAVRSLFRPR